MSRPWHNAGVTAEQLIDAARTRLERFSEAKATHFALAPGRVNLIGEHTDYQDGFVLPVAINRYVAVAAVRTEERVTLESQGRKTASFRLNRVSKNLPIPRWAKYPAGVAYLLGKSRIPPIHACSETNLPSGAGLSSSAALEAVFAALWASMAKLPESRMNLARICQKAEHEFAGVQCGIMDQTAIFFGKAGHALFIDTAEPEKAEPVPLPAGILLAVCDTRVKHSLGTSSYNERRAQVEEAASQIGVPTLRHATLIQTEKLPEPLRQRARHVVGENERVLGFREALAKGDLDMLGHLMERSHASLRDDYEVSCPELDVMAEAARRHPSCIGARMTGAGFGGSCIALVREEGRKDFEAAVLAEYQERCDRQGKVRFCQAVDGVRAWTA